MSEHQKRAEIVKHLCGGVNAKRLRTARILNLRWNTGNSKCDCCREYARFVITGTESDAIVVCTRHALASFRVVLEDGELIA